jgi:TonB family protein
MSRVNTWEEPFLPWVESQNDRRFKRILLICVAIFTVVGLIVPYLPTSEPVQKDLKSVSPRLAQLILEKKKLPPPVPKAVPKKLKEKPVVKKKLKKPVKRKLTPKQKTAQKVAASSGLVALSDELNDLRDTFDLSEFSDQPLSKAGKSQKQDFSNQSVISSKALKSSGGINTGRLSQSTGGGTLASRSTTKVSSKIAANTPKKSLKRSKSGKLVRAEYEIEQVFQKNKGAIYSIYNRALRKDPSLQGKVVIELTIAANGRVTAVKILSSDLNSPKLEKKIKARVKLFKFKPGNTEPVTVKYPIDFLPS